jgi:predicted DNA-binding protein
MIEKARIAQRVKLKLAALSNKLDRTETTIVNDAIEFYCDLFEAGTMSDDELLAKVKAELKTKDK